MRTIVSHLDILRNIAAYVDIRSLSLTHYESDTKNRHRNFIYSYRLLMKNPVILKVLQ